MAEGERKPRIITRGQADDQPARTAFRLVPRIGASEVRHSDRKPRYTIDPLQLVTVAVVVALLIHALALILRAGFDNFDLFDPHVQVAGLHGTRLSAVIEGVLGVVLLYGIVGIVDQTALRILGFLLGIAGAVLLIEPESLHQWLGVHEDNGAVALVVGVLLVLGSLTPVLNVYPKPPPAGRAPWER